MRIFEKFACSDLIILPSVTMKFLFIFQNLFIFRDYTLLLSSDDEDSTLQQATLDSTEDMCETER